MAKRTKFRLSKGHVALLGSTPRDSKADLVKVYGDQALSRVLVLRWTYCFKSGRKSLEDDPRSGWLSSVYSGKEKENLRHTAEDLAEITNIDSSAISNILKEQLKLKKVCTRCIPPSRRSRNASE